MESAYETIRAIIEEKKAANRRPLHALSIEINRRNDRPDIQTELLMLVELGLVKTGRTANYRYYKLQ